MRSHLTTGDHLSGEFDRMGILYVVPFMFLQNIVAAFVAMIPVRAGRAIGNLILIGYIMDFSATIYRQKKENLQESTDEEQIQQIEQSKRQNER